MNATEELTRVELSLLRSEVIGAITKRWHMGRDFRMGKLQREQFCTDARRMYGIYVKLGGVLSFEELIANPSPV
jgi:hypothetical protein